MLGDASLRMRWNARVSRRWRIFSMYFVVLIGTVALLSASASLGDLWRCPSFPHFDMG